MAVAGTLAVNIISRTQQFVKGIKAARDSVKGLQGFLGRVNRSFGQFGLFTGGVGAAAMLAFGKSVVDSTDRLAKLSEQLGTTTDQMSVLQFQADLAGANLEQVATSMRRMTRVIVDANAGLKTAQRPFERLNMSFEELGQLDPVQAFQKIGRAIGDMEKPLEASATSMEIFGRSGAELIPLFRSDMGKAARAFERMGGAIRQSDANKLVAFKDAMTELRAATSVFGRDFVIGITPSALQAVEGLKILMDQLRGPRGAQTAFEDVVQRRRGIQPGSTFSAERMRQAMVSGLGEAIAWLFNRDPRGIGGPSGLTRLMFPTAAAAIDQSLRQTQSLDQQDFATLTDQSRKQTQILNQQALATKPF